MSPKVKRPIHAFDRVLVGSFFIFQIVILLAFGHASSLGIGSPILAGAVLLAVGIVAPYLFWNWCMGFVIYLHHTHPEVPWFGDKEQWTFFAGQVGCVVHVELPRPIELFLHNILDHTAHHVDPKIPLYNLPDAQRRLEDAYPEQIKVVPFTLGGFRRTLKTCRLYDYDTHQWLDYDGVPLSEPIQFRRKPEESIS
jgi:omega-6 fatty acid desaturase (delta-12 desaturase)